MFKTSIFKGQKDDVKLRAKYQGSDSLPFKVSALSAFRMIKLYWCSKDSKNSWLLLFFIVSLTSGIRTSGTLFRITIFQVSGISSCGSVAWLLSMFWCQYTIHT